MLMTFQTVRSLPTDLLVPTLRARQAHALALPLHYQMTLLWPDLQKKMGAVLCTTITVRSMILTNPTSKITTT